MKKLSKIINQQTKEVCIAAGETPDTAYFLNAGFCEQEIETNGDGRFYLAGFLPPKQPLNNEEIRQLRSQAYAQEVDKLTLEISRLKDNLPNPAIENEIAELSEQRQQKVLEIKQKYPYKA